MLLPAVLSRKQRDAVISALLLPKPPPPSGPIISVPAAPRLGYPSVGCGRNSCSVAGSERRAIRFAMPGAAAFSEAGAYQTQRRGVGRLAGWEFRD